MANNANINVSASGLNDILASLIAMQKAMKSVTEAAKKMQTQINTPTNPNGGGAGAGNNGSAGNSAAAERLRRESNSSTRVLTDNARRESMAFVSAYAEIASSVFALTAAFNALKNAAQFGVMLQAQDNFARATGVNLQSIAKVMQQTTKYALDFQQAAQFSSIGRLAGFSTEQIKKLAETGTSAATILGRDVPEALSRMFRGVAKGEPEILDELGIFIRLDNAYKEYIKTVAKGQKVLDLSAYQRRQATYYAAIASGKQMADGNANAKIDDFTIAAAQFSTSFKTMMVTVTDVLGPVVRFLTQNTGLLVATLALLGGKVLSNLGNILFNVTAAKTAQAAILAKQTENKTFIQDNRNKLLGEKQVNKLIAERNALQAQERTAQDKMIKDYQKVQNQIIKNNERAGRISAAQAGLARGMVANLGTAPFRQEALANAAARAAPLVGPAPGRQSAAQRALNASAIQVATLATQANTAAVAANAAAQQRASNLSVTGWGRVGASINIVRGNLVAATLQVQAFGAAINTFAMRGIAAIGALASAASILFIGFIAAKAALSFSGAMGKNVSETEDALASAGKQTDKVLASFDKLGKSEPLNFTEGINNAKIYSSVLDSMGAELDVLSDKFKDLKVSDTRGFGSIFGQVETEKAVKIIANTSRVLSKEAQSSVLEAAKQAYESYKNVQLESAGRLVKNTYKDTRTNLNVTELIPAGSAGTSKLVAEMDSNANKATASMRGFGKALNDNLVPSSVLKAVVTETARQTALAGKSAGAWVGAVEGVAQAVGTLQKNFSSLVNTLMSESVYTSTISQARVLTTEARQARKELELLKDIEATPENKGLLQSKIQTAQVLTQTLNELRNLPTESIDPTLPIQEQVKLAVKSLIEVESMTQGIYSNFKKLRNKDIESTNATAAANDKLLEQGKIFKAQGFDVDNLVTLMQKYTTEQAKLAKIQSNISAVKKNRNIIDPTDGNAAIALADAERSAKLVVASVKSIIKGGMSDLSASNLFRDIMQLPKDLAAPKEVEAFIDKLGKVKGITTEDVALMKELYIKGALVNKDIENSLVPLKGHKDVMSDIKAINDKIYSTTTLGALQNQLDILKNQKVESKEKEAQILADKEKYIDALSREYSHIVANNAIYSAQLNMAELFNQEMQDSSVSSQKTAATLSGIFSGLNVDIAEKIATIESKLQEAAVTNAKKSIDAVLVTLSNPDIGIDVARGKDQQDFLQATKDLDIARKLGTKGEKDAISIEQKRNILREKMINDSAILALLESKNIHLNASQIAELTRTAKENKWGDLMIESAKEVTSAWQDVKDTIARGMGKDGSSLSDSIKGALGKGKSGILDAITGKISQKQDSAFSTLESKAKNFFLGSKDDKGNKLPGALSKLGDKITTAFPSVGKAAGFLGDLGGLDLLKGVLSKNESQRNASIGGALGSVAGKSIGLLFGAAGGPIGMALGSVLGNVVGSVFSKKLKETGVLAKVSELGVVSANSIQIFKKTGLSGTKTIEQVGNSLEAEAISALQTAVTNTRKSYEANILSFNAMTKDVFQLTIGGMSKAFSAKYLQAAGGGKSESDLLKDFIKDYGNFLGSDQLGFLNQFKDVTESLTDVLARLVNTIKVTDTAFKSAFGKGISMIGDLTKSYSGNFLKTQAKGLVDGLIQQLNMVQGTFGAVYEYNGLDVRVGMAEQLNKLMANTLVTTKGFSRAKPLYADSGTPNGSINLGTNTPNGVKPLPTSYLTDYFEKMNEFEKANSTGLTFFSKEGKETLNTLSLIEKFIRGTITPSEKIYLAALAAQDFTDRIVKAFDGENIAAKTEAYNKAMFGYTNMVSNTISVTSGQIASLITDMSRVNDTILPPGLQAVKNGLLVPVQEFNNEMRKAVENGVSPEKIAEGIKLGSKLSEVINGVLETFSSINLNDLKGASDFSTSVRSAITGTFKSSATDSFKKSLLAPLLVDLTTSIDKASVGDSSGFVSSMKNYALSGDIVANQAKNMVQVLSDPAFKSAMDSVSIEFEKLMKVFDSANSSEIMSSLSKAILDIEKTLKESAYSFAVSGDAYSVALFKAKEAFKAAGLSSDYATQPIGSVVAKMKQLASTGLITTTNIDAVNDALNAMADASIAARDQIQATVEASAASMDSANSFISSLTNSIISDSDSMSAAKTALTGLLTVASDKVDKARAEYAKARASGNLLAANQAAENLTSSLESYVNQEIEVNNTLKSMAEDRYNTEKAALDNLKTIIADIADFIKELKFDDKLSILKPIDRLNEASKDFEATKAKVLLAAASGKLTPEAIKNLQDDSKRLLDLGRDAYASSDAYTALYNSVTAAMGVVNGRAEADVLTYEASTKMYQDMALSFAKDTRDIQVDALTQLKILTKASAVDNAIAVDMINALKYNKELGGSVTLSDYYKELFKDAQGGGTIFTQPNTGYQEFNNVGTYDEANKVAQEVTNAKLNLVLETLTTVLQNLPVNVKSAIQSTATPTTNRN